MMKRLQLLSALFFVALSLCAQTSVSHIAPDGLKWTEFTENSRHGAKVGHSVVVPAQYNSIAYTTCRLTFGIFDAWADGRLDLYNTDGKLLYSQKGEHIGFKCFEIHGRKYMCISIGNAREIIYGILVDEDGNVIINGEDYNVWSIGYIDCNGVYVFMGRDKSGKRILFNLDGDEFLDDLSGVGFFYNSGFFFTDITEDNVCHGAFYGDGDTIYTKDFNITWNNGTFYEVSPSGEKYVLSVDWEDANYFDAYNGEPVSTDKGEMWYFKSNDLVGLKNSAGKVIVPAQYNDVVYCEEPDGFSYLAACKEDKVAVYNLDGKVIIPLSSGFNEVTMIGCPGRGCFLATKNVLDPIYSLIDFDGKTLIPISYKYNQLYYYSKSFIVGRNGKVGLWDMFGKVIIPVSRGYENFFLTGDDQALCVRNGEDYGLCDLKGVEKVAPVNKEIKYNKDDYTFEITKHNGTKEYKRAWFAPEDYSNQTASTTPSKSASTSKSTASTSKPASSTKSSSNTKTYYRFTTISNGVVTPSDDAAVEVTFNSDNSLTIEGRKWTYNSKIRDQGGWENGHDYVTFSNNMMMYTHEEYVVIMWMPSLMINFTDTPTSYEKKLEYANLINSTKSAPSGSSSSSSSPSPSTRSSSSSACPRCGGTGTVIGQRTGYAEIATKETYCNICKKKVFMTHYHDTCPSCKGSGIRR